MALDNASRMGWRAIALAAAAAGYLVVIGFVGGVAVERIRFDAHRQSAVKRLDEEKERLRARAIALERAFVVQHDRPVAR